MTARDPALVEALRKSLKDNQALRRENEALRDRRHEPIAIVGLACRFPGGVRTPEDLWRLAVDGVDAVGALPTDRGWPDPHGATPGTLSAREGGFLADAADFDAAFFGISPREATAMDPQQRLLLETAWEALERAGISLDAARTARTGVFVGVLDPDYGPPLDAIPDELSGYALTGGFTGLTSGRISYHLGLTGPAVTVGTACSTALVGMHLAAASLRAGECDVALAGAATVMATPGLMAEFDRQGGLAPDGRCKAFAEDADGTSLGEGVGVVALARLSVARERGYPVLAVLRGSAVNQDGPSNGLTAPSGRAQEQVLRAALASAGLAPDDVDAVEAHGTGTRLGDPVEAQAIAAVFGGRREPLWLGSVKSNIGHAQAAAGVAGVIKAVHALRAGVLPATLHVGEPSTHVDWRGVRLPRELTPWPAVDRPRRMGVSAFGISGTNAHVVLEQPPAAAASSPAAGALPFVLSARDAEGLADRARELRAHLVAHPEAAPGDVAFTLAVGRSALERRAVVVAGDREALLAGLARCAAGEVRVGGPDAAAEAFLRGEDVDWTGVFGGARRVDLPTYPFRRARYWWRTAAAAVPVIEVEAPAAPAAETVDALVRGVLADILGHAPAALDEDASFDHLGLTSVGALDLRARLTAATGLALPATLAFDHPTPRALADHLRGSAVAPVDAPDAAKEHEDDPVVIVGMGCRFPGDVVTPDDLWDLLRSRRDAVGDLPDDRGWDVAALYHPEPGNPGTTYARHGGFLRDAAGFDPTFFGISPHEALAMDPQQRLLLETSWEALEHAGVDPTSLRGSDTGVFVGIAVQDYGTALSAVPADLHGHLMTGMAASVASGRVSYALGLRGPALTVDTACSSSLVSLHLAAQSLRAGECSLALAGGATVLGTAGPLIEFSAVRGLSPDGRSKAYSDSADGVGWGEGAGVVVLERLSAARRRGHPVLAVLRSSAVNQDGASNGLTAPSSEAQRRLLLDALYRAGLTPDDVDAVEGHGTGTTLGDPIEARALVSVYGARRAPLWLGSLKSNIGHTQAAAGVGGVIKAVLALRAGVLPATLHVDAPSSHVEWGGVRVLDAERPWPEVDRPRRMGVSAFGMSGTNAHVILEQAPGTTEPPAAGGPALCVLSGRTEQALRDQAVRLADHLGRHPDLALADVAATLAHGRASFAHRAAVVAEDLRELVDGLRAVAKGEPPRPGRDARLEAEARRYVRGEAVDRSASPPATGRARVALPTYPFQRKRFWAGDQATRPVPAPAVPAPAVAPPVVVEPVPEPVTGDAVPVRPAPSYPEPDDAELAERVRDEVAAVLGFDADDVDPDVGFFELGLDSVMALKLRTRLEVVTGRTLSTTTLFTYPTVTGLAAKLAADAPAAPAAPTTTQDDLVAQLAREIELAGRVRRDRGAR
ncbi:ketoacyl-synthetase-like protein [Saccharothrix texasensis]|uniref:Ketoacyl-synthetase-like protein n=1 Tax=Saccharothrix texasensis TaxID=103734 RepID=A0A3N1GXF8_9PSEU|nr:beta-ketoacyl synthase N-terminal-like domain-containing protein [Saccharothrix texasensis]ROP34829.1 ketoacyl-synthetase-like protein [Saccharothrix texasensis]